jgi:hypothetical protein
VAHCAFINRTVEEVVAYQLVPKRFKGMCGIALVTAVQTLPVDEISPARSAFAALVRRHLLQLLEAVQIVVAVSRRAFDVERRRFLEFRH